jgi:hypothetical protein
MAALTQSTGKFAISMRMPRAFCSSMVRSGGRK